MSTKRQQSNARTIMIPSMTYCSVPKSQTTSKTPQGLRSLDFVAGYGRMPDMD